MTKIYAPNKRYTGIIAGVSFVDGVGETNNQYLIGWFKEKGYTVENEEVKENLIHDIAEAFNLAIREDIIKELESKKADELKELAKEKGIEGYSRMKKEELIKAIEGE